MTRFDTSRLLDEYFGAENAQLPAFSRDSDGVWRATCLKEALMIINTGMTYLTNIVPFVVLYSPGNVNGPEKARLDKKMGPEIGM